MPPRRKSSRHGRSQALGRQATKVPGCGMARAQTSSIPTRACQTKKAMKPAGETHGDRGPAKSPSRMKEHRINRLPLGDGFHRMFYMSDCLRPLKLATHGLRGRLRRIASRTKLVEVTLNHTPPVSGQANDHPSCRFECCRTLIPRAGTCHQVIGARPDRSVLLGTYCWEEG